MIIKNIAEQFGVSFQNINNERICAFHPNFGSGYVKSSYYDSGIEIIEIKGSLKKPLTIKNQSNNNLLLNIIFNLRWASSYKNTIGNIQNIDQFSCILNSQNKDQNSSFDLGINESISLFIVFIHVNIYQEKFDQINFDDDSNMTEFLRNLTKGKYIYSKNNYTLSLQNLILKYQQNTYLGKMRYVYQEAKATEIVLESFNQYLADFSQNNNSINKIINSKKIESAAVLISKQLDNPGTTKEIAQSVNLSEGSLQSGFKNLFNCTVNQFIVDLRLNKAIDLLDNSEYNISEITYELGIKSKSYFSKVFKAKFGVSPLKYRQLTNKKRQTNS